MRQALRTSRKRTDVMTPEQRRKCMANIKGRNTGPEVSLRLALWAAGLRYRLGRNLPGKPDIVFGVPRLAVFVDGCFWHGCPLHATKPKAHWKFWRNKLRGNRIRDRKVNAQLRKIGWDVCRVWEHEVERNSTLAVQKILRSIKRRLKQNLKTEKWRKPSPGKPTRRVCP